MGLTAFRARLPGVFHASTGAGLPAGPEEHGTAVADHVPDPPPGRPITQTGAGTGRPRSKHLTPQSVLMATVLPAVLEREFATLPTVLWEILQTSYFKAGVDKIVTM